MAVRCGCFRPILLKPILLKKSVSVSTVEKYAPEIEIHVLSTGVRTQIRPSSVQKMAFSPLNAWLAEQR